MKFFVQKLQRAMEREMARKIKLKRSTFLAELKDLTYWILFESDTIQSLLGRAGEEDNLAYHFGLWAGSEPSIVEEIIQIITGNIYDKFDGWKSTANGSEGNFRILLHGSTIDTLVESSIGKIDTAKGEQIPWLEWLLTRGNEIIIADYHIKFGFAMASRSGGAIMAPTLEWSVPSQFAGTRDDNWITRALTDDTYQAAIGRLIQNVLL